MKRKNCKRINWAVIGLVVMVLVVGCSKPVQAQGNNEAQVTEGSEGTGGVQEMKIRSFSFSHNGMSMEQCYNYDLKKEEGKTILTCSVVVPGQGFVDTSFEVDEGALEEFEKLVNEYQLWKWDGFNEYAKDILDGAGFSMSFETEDGKRISAHGSNSFPKNYSQVGPRISSAFNKVVVESGKVYPRTVVREGLTEVYVNYSKSSENKLFSVNVQQNASSLGLSITVYGYEDKLGHKTYTYRGACGSFPFEEVQEVVKKYDLLSLNGWNVSDYEPNKDYFCINLGYESGEYITMEGDTPPRDYEAVKEELIDILSTFINENEPNFQ